MDSIRETTVAIANFSARREWGKFHSGRNLAESLTIEAAEVLEVFQWDREVDRAELRLELADVAIYLLELADLSSIDLLAAVREKLEINEKRYPVEKCRGSNRKYDRL